MDAASADCHQRQELAGTGFPLVRPEAKLARPCVHHSEALAV